MTRDEVAAILNFTETLVLILASVIVFVLVLRIMLHTAAILKQLRIKYTRENYEHFRGNFRK